MLSTLVNDAAIFLADFGEDVIYYPRVGLPRKIKALVDRNVPVQASADGPLSAAMLITVANSSLTGIATTEVDGRGADQVEVAPRIGAEAKRMGVFFVGAGFQGMQDPGMATFELR